MEKLIKIEQVCEIKSKLVKNSSDNTPLKSQYEKLEK